MAQRTQIRAAHPTLKSTEISKKMMEEWSNMSERQKDPYHELAAKDRDRYNEEKEKGRKGFV